MPNPPEVTLSDICYALGWLTLPFVALNIGLLMWLVRLFLRTRSFTEYVAYLATTFYPLLLSVLAAIWLTIGFVNTFGNNGIADPSPITVARYLGELLLRLFVGCGMTCFYFPLGILALIMRGPK